MSANTKPGSSRNSSTPTNNSLSSVISTLIPVLITAAVVVSLFLVFRRKYDRVYNPRGMKSIVPVEQNRSDYDTKSAFGWIPGFRGKSDTFVLNHNSIDGFLFLRFLKLLIVLTFVGCCITWPILFPINATGGGTQTGLDVLNFSNIGPNSKNRLYAHAIVAWIFLGFVMLVWAHERMFFIGLRHAYFFTPFHANRLSSRVVMFLSVPQNMLTEAAIRESFGATVRRVWFAYDCKQLEEQVKNRTKLVAKVEAAEMKTILNSNKERMKAEKNGAEKSNPEAGNDPYRYVSKKPLTHRLKFLIGKKVETIKYGREEIPKMSADIATVQEERLAGKGDQHTAVFVEFSSQMTAQDAFGQVEGRFPKKHMSPHYIGVHPDEIIWKNLKKSNSSRMIMKLLATIVVALMIIFWTIPVGFVGTISHVNSLTAKVPFLGFINKIPSVILGVVTGLLPSVLLALLVALVPVFCRMLAKLAGCATLSQVELQTQKWYFWFQIIQVFLITTVTSGAAAVVSNIIQKPSSAATLLAQNLPKASNFYLSFIIVYGLGQSSLIMLAVGTLAVIAVVGPFLDKTPRKQYTRWFNLAGLGWGSEYPKFTNLGVIALAYSSIAPLVMGFAFIGFLLLYIGFRYNWLYVFGNKVDMKGESYPVALHQLLGGVYLSIIVLAGLFGISKSWGPLALMIIFLLVVILFQFLVSQGLKPLEPISRPSDVKSDLTDADVARHYGGDVRPQSDGERTTVGEEYEMKAGMNHGTNGQHHGNGDKHMTTDHSTSTKPSSKKLKGNFLTQRLAPYVHKFYESGKPMVADCHDEQPHYDPRHLNEAYLNPAIVSEVPIIWLAKDHIGLSDQMVLENKESGLLSSDEGAWLNEKNKIEWDVEEAEAVVPIFERKVNY